MRPMKKVLIISYFYPPYHSIGAIRVSKFTKYLPEHGWIPLVLTAANDYAETLPLEVDPDVVHRTRQLDINRLPKRLAGRRNVSDAGYVAVRSSVRGRVTGFAREFCRHVINFPDGQIGWYPYACRAGLRLIAR